MNTCDHSALALSCSTSTRFDPVRFLPARVHWRWHPLHTLCTRPSFRCLPACKLARATVFHPYPFLRFPVHHTHCNTSAEMVSVRSKPPVNLPDPQPSGRRSGQTCASKRCQVARGKRERAETSLCQSPLIQADRALAVKIAPSKCH